MFVERFGITPIFSKFCNLNISRQIASFFWDFKQHFFLIKIDKIVITKMRNKIFNWRGCCQMDVLNHWFWHNIQNTIKVWAKKLWLFFHIRTCYDKRVCLILFCSEICKYLINMGFFLWKRNLVWEMKRIWLYE